MVCGLIAPVASVLAVLPEVLHRQAGLKYI